MYIIIFVQITLYVQYHHLSPCKKMLYSSFVFAQILFADNNIILLCTDNAWSIALSVSAQIMLVVKSYLSLHRQHFISRTTIFAHISLNVQSPFFAQITFGMHSHLSLHINNPWCRPPSSVLLCTDSLDIQCHHLTKYLVYTINISDYLILHWRNISMAKLLDTGLMCRWSREQR